MKQAVLVVGGGPAGSAAAIELGRRGMTALLFEQAPRSGNKLSETLYPEAEAQLCALAPPQVAKVPLSVNYVGRDGATTLTLSLSGRIGAVDRNDLDRSLRAAAVAAGAQLIPSRVGSIALTSAGISLSAGGVSYEGSYLIDASGKNPVSIAGGDDGRPTETLDRRFSAFSHFVCSTGFVLDHATIVALDNGFAYVLPIHADRICVGITSYDVPGDEDLERAYVSKLRESSFLSAVVKHAQRVLPVIPAKNAQTFNAGAEGGRLLRAGDALGFRDPFLWDGLSFGLQSGSIAGVSCAQAMMAGELDEAGYVEAISRLERTVRENAWQHYDDLTRLFNAAMSVDPHVSPMVLSCLFSLTGGQESRGLTGLRRELSLRRSVQ